jgi:two-component system chemotaxis response regulator CheB
VLLNSAQRRRDVIVVGASAGGFDPMFRLLAAIPTEPSMIVAAVLHRSPFSEGLADVVQRATRHAVVEPVESVAVEQGVIYLAPRDMHLVFEDGHVLGVRSAKRHFTRPAVDVMFESAAEQYGARVIGVLLSGAGGDGANGLIRIKACGGLSLVQSPSEAQHPSMPVMALREDHVDAALPIDELIEVVPALAKGLPVDTHGHLSSKTAFANGARMPRLL